MAEMIYAVIEADFKLASYQLMHYNPLLPMPQGDNVRWLAVPEL